MEKELKIDDRPIHYRRLGHGPTLILVHGFLESSIIWDSLSISLSEEFTLIIPDLPGHGKSPSYADTHTMDSMAIKLARILEYEKISSFAVVGHSMGGYVALALAQLLPKSVKGICLFHSQVAADSPEATTNRMRTIRAVEEHHTGFIRQFIPDLFAEQNLRGNVTTINILKREASKMSPADITASIRGMMQRPDRMGFLSQCEFPILFIAGKYDKRIPYSTVFEQASTLKHAELLLLNDAAHMGWAEKPEICNKALKYFALKCFEPNH